MSNSWVSASIYSTLPVNAVLVGRDTDRSAIYVARAKEGCATLPAKAIPSKRACYVAYNGKEIMKHDFEYLVGSGFQWVSASNGSISEGAVVGGNDPSGEVLYIGRASHLNSVTPGKIHRTHGCLYIPYNGHEVAINHYEVLVRKSQCLVQYGVGSMVSSRNQLVRASSPWAFQKPNCEVSYHQNVQCVHSCNCQIVRNAVPCHVAESEEVLYYTN